jgi:hypothetical protein
MPQIHNRVIHAVVRQPIYQKQGKTLRTPPTIKTRATAHTHTRCKTLAPNFSALAFRTNLASEPAARVLFPRKTKASIPEEEKEIIHNFSFPPTAQLNDFA